jgi:hypothetical protein
MTTKTKVNCDLCGTIINDDPFAHMKLYWINRFPFNHSAEWDFCVTCRRRIEIKINQYIEEYP